MRVICRVMAVALTFLLLFTVGCTANAENTTQDTNEVGQSVKHLAPEPNNMVGEWELLWTEIQGERIESGPDVKVITVTSDDAESFLLSYKDNERSDWSYYDRKLTVIDEAIYSDCVNNQWSAIVDYIGNYDTEYTVTLLDEDTLLMKQYWLVDGAPMVGYECFQRIAGIRG